MGDKTKIEWTDATWNPITGCTRISEGCNHCYIESTPPFRQAGRKFSVTCPRCRGAGGTAADGGTCWECGGEGYVPSGGIGASTGVSLHPERLDQPLRWQRPRRVFVNSLSDLFHEDVPTEYIAKVFAVMGMARNHTFQVLTKRPARMRVLMTRESFWNAVGDAMCKFGRPIPASAMATAYRGGPFPKVWLGVTVENQHWADVRIPLLLETPAAVRFLSVEPMLGPVKLDLIHVCDPDEHCGGCSGLLSPKHEPACGREPGAHWGVDWVICGGESGPDARPMDPEWARSLRDQCVGAGVPFHFKQAGSVLAREWGGHGKGGDPADWPEPFAREYPDVN